jgi:hypothetical protein
VSGISGRIVTAADVSTVVGPGVPPAEFHAPADQLAVQAAERLGWQGVVLPEMTLLGRKVHVVAQLLSAPHAERICLNAGPVTDRVEVSTWVWPEMAGRVPPPAVRIMGVLSVAKHWRTALASAVPFARYGEAAVVLPSSSVLTHDYLFNGLPRARRFGVTVLTADPDRGVELDSAARPDIPTAELCPDEDAVIRWVNEAVYGQLLGIAG